MYRDLWTVLLEWKMEFSVRDFASTFPSPSVNKVLHDMMKKGYLKRIGWGKYRVIKPQEYLREKMDVAKAYELVAEAGLDYAFTGPDAVFVWTKGGYNADRFVGFYPIHMGVLRKNLDNWREFFEYRNRRFYVKDARLSETLFGLFYVLYPEVRIHSERVEGMPVIPLNAAVKFCRDNFYTYEPALEMLDEMYNLRLKVSYREVKTNR